MIDLHTHTLLSDGELLPSELVRRAEVKGYTAIALTDHVDSSNIDFVLPRIVRVCKVLNRYWNILSIPGVEITHAPLQEIKGLVRFARKNGAKIIIVHGETVAEPVIRGTNRAAIEAGCDILAHPGLITEDDIFLAKIRGVYLEITTRKNHCRTNKRLFGMAKKIGAKLVLDNDAHNEKNLVTRAQAMRVLRGLGMSQHDIRQVVKNSEDIVRNKKPNRS
ncbi:MAG: histidinol phosphate phosphatase domain-containing protein [Candidatus Omnitrophota bacterium]|nr:histidinol phosphate phosphatase domain-containing protein [Candidatus Omnitrophota bacterium]